MAFPICAEAYLRSFFVILRIAWDNWFWTLLIIVILGLMRKSPVMQGGLGTIIDLLQDSRIGLSIFSGGILSIAGKLLIGSFLSVLLGIIWMMMVLTNSNVNIVLKIFAMPALLVAGMIAGILPFVSIPISLVLGLLLKNKATANMTCIVTIALIAILIMLNLGWFCGTLNSVATLLQ